MTDWERVRRLRAKGRSWDEVARDPKVGYRAPAGVDPGRGLKALNLVRQSRAPTGRKAALSSPATAGARFRRIGASRSVRYAFGVGVAVLLISISLHYLLAGTPPGAPSTDAGPGTAGSQQEFNYLSQQTSDSCSNLNNQQANVNWIDSLQDGTFLQGSCCTPMDYPDYSTQIPEDQQNYSSIPVVPLDPYNVPAATAKAMVADVDTGLTPAQQAVYDQGTSMSTDKAPCCCWCWAGYAHEGMVKYVIINNGYSAQQVTDLLNTQDCCGGPGQMHMG